MIICSVPSATVQHRLDLPEIGRDYFLPEQKVLENEFIATSTASAGFFRQLVKYDISSVKRNYTVILSLDEALILYAMVSSVQTSFNVVTATGTYEVNMTAELVPNGKIKTTAVIGISVIRKVL